MKPLKLFCPVMHYSWGKSAESSFVAELSKRQSAGRWSAADKPYAEFWIGAHPNAPAQVKSAGGSGSDSGSMPLNLLLAQRPEEILGISVLNRFGPQLPFLAKVLSINSALSIQAHPDKRKAELLHLRQPDRYPDSSHKPELAYALTPVSLLHGFRPVSEIRGFLSSIPELALVLDESADSLNVADIEAIYKKLLHVDDKRAAECCKQLYRRISQSEPLLPEEQWIFRLKDQYPEGDIGLFSFFLMNLQTLAPGEAIFIGANVVHAYLEGDLVECMANSDNVIRAGLTSKYRDAETLLQTLDYSVGAAKPLVPDVSVCGSLRRECYSVPAEEFALEKICGRGAVESIDPNKRVEILFCLQGSAELGLQSEKYMLDQANLLSYSGFCGAVPAKPSERKPFSSLYT